MTNPDPVIIHNLFGIQNLNIYWCGLFAVFGIAAAILFIRPELKRLMLPRDAFSDICIACIPAALLLGRAGYVLFNQDEFNSLTDALALWKGGVSFFGVLVGALAGVLIYSGIKKVPFSSVCDAAAPGILLAQSIIRWGDFFNQTSYGPLVTNRNHMWFPLAVRIDVTGEIHYAIFFYESLWCLINFIIIWFIIRKRAKRRGDTALAYLALYSLGHAFVEYINMDTPMFNGIKIYSVFSAVIFFAAVITVVVRALYSRKPERNAQPGGLIGEPETQSPETAERTIQGQGANSGDIDLNEQEYEEKRI